MSKPGTQRNLPFFLSSVEVKSCKRAPRGRCTQKLPGCDQWCSHHCVGRPGLSSKFETQPIFPSFSKSSRRLIPRNQAYDCSQAVDIDDQNTARRIIIRTAPRNSTDISGKNKRAAQTRGREQAFVTQTCDLVAAPLAILVIHTEGVIGTYAIRNQRFDGNGEWLGWRGNLPCHVAGRNRAFFNR